MPDPAPDTDGIKMAAGVTGGSGDPDLAADGAPAAAAARDKPPRRKGRGGPRPGSGRPTKEQTTAKQTAAIEKALADLLTVPAIPCGMLGHPWPANHFATQGPVFAHQLAEISATNPALRGVLERALQGGTYAALFMAAFGYTIPPVVYFMAGPTSPLRSMLGVPGPPPPAPTAGARQNGTHAAGTAQPAQPAPGPSGPAGESRPA